MISPHRIKYNKIFSNELGILDLIMDVSIDSDSGETSTFLNRSEVVSESYDGRYKNTIRYKYDEAFAPKFTFMKNNFECFTMEEVRYLLKYLTSIDTTSLLEVYYDDSNVVSFAAIGGWTEINLHKISNSGTVAITAVFSSIMPYALSDLYTITKTPAAVINTPMYYWRATGTGVPTYLLTFDAIPKIGTVVYSSSTEISESVINVNISLYGAISAMEDETYTVNSKVFSLELLGTKTKRTYDNKIVINIDTDEPQQAVFPRITIKQEGIVVPVTPETIYTATSNMVENTVYFNGTTYYWKTAPSTDAAYFNSSATNPNLSTTSVRFTNQHTDFFNQPSNPILTVVKNNTSTEEVVLDGANKIISTNSTRRIFGDDFNWQWLELYDGKNEITIEGNCEVTLEWREVRKIGEY